MDPRTIRVAADRTRRFIRISSTPRSEDRGLRFVVEASPQIPGRDGAIRTPGVANLRDAPRCWELAQTVYTFHCVDDPQIADGQHVRAVKAEHQKHLRGPDPDA